MPIIGKGRRKRVIARGEEGNVALDSNGRVVKTFVRRELAIKGKPTQEQVDEFKAGFYAHKIAQLLFPGHVLDVKARDWQGKRARQISTLHRFDDTYEEGRKEYYKQRTGWRGFLYRRGYRKDLEEREKYTRQQDRYESPEVVELRRKVFFAGIEFNPHPVNVGFENGKPVFIEIDKIYPERIKEWVKREEIPVEVRERVLKLLARYEKIMPKTQSFY